MTEIEFEAMMNENPDPSEYGWLEEETEAQAQDRMTPAEQQADIDWQQRWDEMVKSGEINDPFAETP